MTDFVSRTDSNDRSSPFCISTCAVFVLCVCVVMTNGHSFRVRFFHERCDQVRTPAKDGDLGTVRRLVEEGTDVNASDGVSLYHIVAV